MTSGSGQPPSNEDANDFVRPFLVTGGRTKSDVEGLQFETLVQSTDSPAGELRFEAAQIYALCTEAAAIAELSAHLKIPIGTIKVVVGDLIKDGFLDVHNTLETTDTPDLDLLARIIEGVQKL